jgi:hypothetical protein
MAAKKKKKQSVAKKPLAKNPPAKKPVAKKPVAKKPVAKPAAKPVATPVAKKPVAAKAPAAAKAPVAPPAAVEKKAPAIVSRPPIDRESLDSPEACEAALDTLGVWFVEALSNAEGNSARASQVIRAAISAFYDIREAADQERGEYAGHFFMVDAVGIDDTERPVPWVELEKRVGPEQMAKYEEIFEEIEPDVE